MKRLRPLCLVSTATAFAIAPLAAACAGTDPPAQSRIAVDFPSTAAALATETLVIQIFDGGDENVCADLVEKRRTGQPLPTPLFAQRPLSVCQYAASKGGTIPLTYGERAFLVVGMKDDGTDLLVGCTRVPVANSSETVDVALSLISPSVTFPPTACASVSDKCGDGDC